MMHRSLPFVYLWFLSSPWMAAVTARAPFTSLLSFLRRPRKSYTPLVFFTVPPGLIPECDAMEQTVRRVEKELGVAVQRLDILRDPASEAVLNAILGSQDSNAPMTPPLLYHRESRQIIHIVPPPTAKASATGSSSSKRKGASTTQRGPLPIDVDRVRAWAKGRYLMGAMSSSTSTSRGDGMSGTSTVAPRGMIMEETDEMIAEAEQLAEMSLTPEQRLGKRRMEERTQAKSISTTSSSASK